MGSVRCAYIIKLVPCHVALSIRSHSDDKAQTAEMGAWDGGRVQSVSSADPGEGWVGPGGYEATSVSAHVHALLEG